MATLKEIQACQLDILKTVADICDRHNIPYFLAAGTFLGAVRHKGFIPWDDDVDIYMEYSDIQKFKKVCKKELPPSLFYQDFETEPGSCWLFTKIRANNTFMPEIEAEKAKKLPYHQGVWIDIFPLLKAADSEEKTLCQINAIQAYQHAITQYMDPSKYKNAKLKHKLINFLYNLHYKRIANKNKKAFEKLQSDASDKMLVLANAYWGDDNKKVIAAALKDSVVKADMIPKEYPFEDALFHGFKEYDGYFSNLYGPDYMTPKRWTHLQDYSDVVIGI
ncbi:MAG: LicD family protein [Ruminococcaceae bacterium]|nr:LicD family protein [Oscillospiraceae bacterium]